MNKKQFSLFVDHNHPIDNEPEKVETKINKIEEENSIILTDFKVSECICGTRRLERVGNIFWCKKCGREYNEYGILFGI